MEAVHAKLHSGGGGTTLLTTTDAWGGLVGNHLTNLSLMVLPGQGYEDLKCDEAIQGEQCVENGDPDGSYIQDAVKCGNSNSQCETRCMCKPLYTLNANNDYIDNDGYLSPEEREPYEDGPIGLPKVTLYGQGPEHTDQPHSKCMQCVENGDPDGEYIQDILKCGGANSQCEMRCSCKTLNALGKEKGGDGNMVFCAYHINKKEHDCVTMRLQGEKKFVDEVMPKTTFDAETTALPMSDLLNKFTPSGFEPCQEFPNMSTTEVAAKILALNVKLAQDGRLNEKGREDLRAVVHDARLACDQAGTDAAEEDGSADKKPGNKRSGPCFAHLSQKTCDGSMRFDDEQGSNKRRIIETCSRHRSRRRELAATEPGKPRPFSAVTAAGEATFKTAIVSAFSEGDATGKAFLQRFPDPRTYCHAATTSS